MPFIRVYYIEFPIRIRGFPGQILVYKRIESLCGHRAAGLQQLSHMKKLRVHGYRHTGLTGHLAKIGTITNIKLGTQIGTQIELLIHKKWY